MWSGAVAGPTASRQNMLRGPNPITRRHSGGRKRPSKTIQHLVANREVTFSLRHILKMVFATDGAN